MLMWIDITKYITVNILLFSSWYLFLFNKRASLSFVDRLIGTFILGLAQIIVTEMILGLIFKKLYADPLFWVNIVMTFTILSFTLSNNKDGFSLIGNVISEFNEKACDFFGIIRSDIILLALFSLLVIKICWLIFIGYLFPSYTWDSLSYHLPIVGNIMQSGAIMENPANFELDTFINIFPKNIELFSLWNIIFLKSRIITDLSQLPFVIIGIITTYSIALKLKISEKSAIFSALLIFFIPILLLQINTNYIDIAVSVLLLVVINYLLIDSPSSQNSTPINNNDRKPAILLSGITAGILLGSKGSGPLFAVILLLAIMVQELIKHRRQLYPNNHNGKVSLLQNSLKPYTLYFILPLFILGSYWYIKNWTLYGNPVYPMEVTVLNITLFKGLFNKMRDPVPMLIENSNYLTRLFHVWMERAEFYLYDSRLSGLGPIWAIILLPSLTFTLIYSAIKKQYNWLFISILLIITFAVHPRNWTSRYTIFIVVLGAVSCGFVMDYFGRKGRLIRIIALVLALYTFIIVNSLCVMPEKIKEFMHLSAEERTIDRHRPFNINIHVHEQYGYWNWINTNIKKDDTVAYTFEQLFMAPLWNDGFSSKIIYVGSGDYDNWIKKLKDRDVTYVLLKQHSEEDARIEEYGYDMPDTGIQSGRTEKEFKMVYFDNNYKILKLAKAEDL